MCSKTSYPTKKDALTVKNYRTRGRNRYRHNRPKDLRAYACDDCGQWHLTHLTNSYKKA